MSTKVLFVIAEMSPLVKVGGLADIGGSLPRALRRLGLDARVALPYYAAIDGEALALRRLDSLPEGAAVWQGEARGVPVYLIEHAPSFGREEVYGYDDDAARFLAFCDGLLAAAEPLASAEPAEVGWKPDVLHLHDWHPGFLAMRLSDGRDHPWSSLARVQTVHNLAFTGPFDEAFAAEHGLQWDAGAAGLAGHLQRSALAHGLLRADLVSTVSPTYAREIVTSEFGGGFERLLQQLGDRLSGIMNGIDVERYDPTTDQHLAATFDAETLERRAENKRALQQRIGLASDPEIPLIGVVSRLFWQKGLDLAATAVAQLQESHRFQFAVLGQGDEENERTLAQLARRFPGRVAARLAFDEPLGQLVYGGCDMFLM
ncbi:MAG: glycogen/starch synthase, partial [Chloroflexi bacterium]|nr:glycogen/starch synthase [Chloroflexota bacterium]